MASVYSNMKTKLKKGDLVKVVTGKDKGKTGKIISFVPKKKQSNS
jgi:large subunit ribosomal protein L24